MIMFQNVLSEIRSRKRIFTFYFLNMFIALNFRTFISFSNVIQLLFASYYPQFTDLWDLIIELDRL